MPDGRVRLEYLSDDGGEFVEVDYPPWGTYRFRPGPDGAFIDVYIASPKRVRDGQAEYWRSRIRVRGTLDASSLENHIRAWLSQKGGRWSGDPPLWGEPYRSSLYWND